MPSILNATTTNGLVTSADNSGSLQLQTNNGTTAVTIDTSQRAAFVAGTAALPAITTSGDTNTGMFFPAADTIAFAEGGTETMRLDSSGNVGIGTSSPGAKLVIVGATQVRAGDFPTTGNGLELTFTAGNAAYIQGYDRGASAWRDVVVGGNTLQFSTGGTERMRITSGGDLLVNKTSSSTSTNGFSTLSNGRTWIVTTDVDEVLLLNRQGSDGNLVRFFAQNTEEGTISVSGTTVSYNGGHLSRWSQLPDNSKDNTILKGTVMSNLDDMCVWVKDGEILPNEQLNKMKVSDVEGDTNVAGVFVNWTRDEDCNSDDMNVAMTGDMIIRIAQGVVVQKSDLLMSAGDGTAKPQGDDIVRSKTIAKVTSNYVTCTYEDGSYCVPCVLMAC